MKKIEIKIKTIPPCSSSKEFDDFKDEIQPKVEKIFNELKEIYANEKKPVTIKPEHSENKTSGSWKRYKTYDDKDYIDNAESENNIKEQFEGDKKYVNSKRIEHRRLESKTDRRIRNKDRPAIEIYRPGMGRLSKLKSDNDCDESESKK